MQNKDILDLTDVTDYTQFPILVSKAEHHGKVGLHSHSFYELVYIDRGFSMHICGDTSTVLTSGDLFIILPGQEHTYVNACHTVLYNCLFTEDIPDYIKESFKDMPWCKNIFDSDPSKPWSKINLGMCERNDFLLYLEKIRWECTNKPTGWKLNVFSLYSEMMVFISRIYNGYRQTKNVSTHIKYVHAALSYIEANRDTEFSVKDIADNVGISADYLSKHFKSIIGITPIDYVKNYKIARAMERLRNTQEPISDVAKSVGFTDMSHFSRQFKQITGVTPSEFRKNGNISDIAKELFGDNK